MDTVFIDTLQLLARIGVLEHEKQAAQTLLVDAEMDGRFEQAGQSDRIDDAIDYAKVAQSLADVAGEKHHQLLEHLGARMAEALLGQYPAIDALRLRLTKPAVVPGARAVGVVVRRQRSGS